jgi:hypothetical protein
MELQSLAWEKSKKPLTPYHTEHKKDDDIWKSRSWLRRGAKNL